MTIRTTKQIISSALLTFGLFCSSPTSAKAQASVDKSKPSEKAGEPVLILHGECSQDPKINKPEGSCETVINKGDFDALVAALDPKMPQSNRLALATEYVKLLVMGSEAKRLKIDQDPAFQELVEFNRLELLERQLVRHLEGERSVVSPADVADFYRQHASRFEEGSFRKIYIPKQGNWSTIAAAEAIQQRAAKGEDFDALQREVWTAQGRLRGAPLTLTGTLRRAILPDAQQKAFDLKPGEVSLPFEEAGGYSIFRLEFKRVLPLSSVENEIRGDMAGERLQERISKLRSAVSVSVNEEYFGALPSTEELARHHGMEHAGSHLVPMSETERSRR
jgi:peptidyl-prolyl cis-trans isomerase C